MERVLLGTVAGFLVVNAGLFTLASIGALYPLVVWPLAVLAALLSIKGHRPGSFVPTAGPSPEKKDRREPPRWAAVALGALLGLIFLGSLVESLYPSPYSADSLAKHLAYPVIFAETRGYVFTPDNPLHFVYSGYWELLLTGVALFVRSEVTLLVMAQILHLILGLGGAALAISCLLRRLAPGDGAMRLALALFGAALFAGMRPEVHFVRRFPLLAVAPKSDLTIVTMQLAAALALVWAIGAGGKKGRRGALLAGLLLGGAAGIKLTAGIAAISLAAGFWLIPGTGLSARVRFRMTGWTTTGLVAALSPMLIKNTIALGNPLYPLFASEFGRYANPLILQLQSGWEGEGMGLAGIRRILQVLIPSAPFLFLFALCWGRSIHRCVYALLASAATSALIGVLVFTDSFPTRYILHVSAFTAVCAACGAGLLIRRVQESAWGGRRLSSPWVRTTAWAVVVILALLPTHIDNRLKRASRTAVRTPSLVGRVLGMSRVSRFQSRWGRHLPEGVKVLTFYHSERLFSLRGGRRVVVAVQSPRIAPLLASAMAGDEMERKLVAEGFTHVYFGSKAPVPEDWPIQPAGFVAHLRRRPPVFDTG